jgi:hypothetical protein
MDSTAASTTALSLSERGARWAAKCGALEKKRGSVTTYENYLADNSCDDALATDTEQIEKDVNDGR